MQNQASFHSSSYGQPSRGARLLSQVWRAARRWCAYLLVAGAFGGAAQLLLWCFGAQPVTAALAVCGTKSIGPGGDYLTLTAAFVDLNTNGVSCAVRLELQADYTSVGETFPLQLNQVAGADATNNITIRPQASATVLVRSSNFQPLLHLNGADYVTIDGLNRLTLRNAANGPALQFSNDASNNVVKSCTLESGIVSTTVYFSTGAVTGNDDNLITLNTIRSSAEGGDVPTYLIFSEGSSTAVANSNNTISDNQLFNFDNTAIRVFLRPSDSAVVNENWTISGNTIYQTAPRVNAQTGILFGAGGTNTISHNVIRDLNTANAVTGIRLQGGNAVTVAGNRLYGFSSSANFADLTGIALSSNLSQPNVAVTLVNNQITLLPDSNNQSIVGLLDQGITGNVFKAYYNSVLIGGTATGFVGSAAFRTDGFGGATTLRNNIFFNNRTGGTGAHLAASDSNSFSSDYNFFVGTGNPTAANIFLRSSTAMGFMTWQAFGYDPHSQALGASAANVNIFLNPAAGNLNLNPAVCNTVANAGTPSTPGLVITTDFDTTQANLAVRDVAHPDIGADEFTHDPPSITLQPEPLAVCVGDQAEFTVTAIGFGALSYQWRKNGANVGTNNNTFTLPSVAAGDAGNYDVVITQSCGAVVVSSVTSMQAALTVNTPPSVTTHPMSQTVAEGATVLFTAAANGTPTPTVQWQVNLADSWMTIPGETHTTLMLSNVTMAQHGRYRAVFSNDCQTEIFSNEAILAVTSAGPQPIIVNHNGDSAIAGDTHCTFREALNNADAGTDTTGGDCVAGTAGLDTIAFALGMGTPAIMFTDSPPTIFGQVIIDGHAGGADKVILNGALVTTFTRGIALYGTGSILRNLVIQGFSNSAGVELSGSGGHTVENCYIGTDAAGDMAKANRIGLSVASPNNIIGPGNLISGNLNYGVVVGYAGNVLKGNCIGTNAAGTLPLPNDTGGGGAGIYLAGAVNAVIGGPLTVDRNIISGNGTVFSYGIRLSGSTTTIQGNYIGTTKDGAGALGNVGYGIGFEDSAGSLVCNNVISGNRFGLAIFGAGSTNNTIKGNLIGRNATNTANLGNTSGGLTIAGDAVNNMVGGVMAEDANVIVGNAGVGVYVAGGATGNAILRNSIFDNAQLGLDLNGDGVTSNDPDDADTGSNGLQNYPELLSNTGGVISGRLKSQPNRTYKIEFFANSSCDASGYGEGQYWLGSITVTTAANGQFDFNSPPFAIPVDKSIITATATDSEGNTSEFSACLCPVITLTPAMLTNGSVGTAYPAVTFSASGGTGPYTFSYSGTLPTGLALTGAVLAGTPSATGTFNFTVQATDASGCVGTQAYSIGVSCPTYTITPSTLPNGTANVFYDQQLTASGGAGGPYQFGFVSGLPPGMFISVNGQLFGTPTAAGTYNFSVPVFEHFSCITSQAYTLTINPPACPTITVNPTTPFVFGVANTVYPNTTIGVSGTGTYSFTHSGLPPGMTLTGTAATTRTLGGTPTTPGAYNLTVTATNNASGCTSSRTFFIVVHADTPTLLVTTADDENGTNPAACSLREAVIAANNNAAFGGCGAGFSGYDTIGFAAPYSIALTGALLGPSEPVFINGLVSGARVELNGAGAAASQVLLLESGYNYVKSLVINRLAGGNAINLSGANAVRNVIEDCRLGTNTAGTAALPNGGGLGVFNAGPFNRIGSVALPNLISGNSSTAVNIVDAPGTSVFGNLIGLQADGIAPLGNGGDGVRVRNTVAPGGTVFVTGVTNNKIAYNATGINIADTALGQRTGLSANHIFNNTGLGIDLGNDGVTPNDVGDTDTGTNRLMNFPVLNSITPTVTGGTVNATLDVATGNASFNVSVQFFASSSCDPSGHGEGESFLGSVSVTAAAAASGFTFNYTAAQVFGRPFITAQATDGQGNASEFSACRAVPNDPPMLSGATLNVRQGDAVALRQIGTAGDAQQAVGTLSFQISNGGLLNGVHVNFTQIQATGEVMANVFAECAATNATFTIGVTDAQNVTTNATLTINVQPNQAPVLSYNPASVLLGSSGGVNPASGPSDVSYTLAVQSVTPNIFAGTVNVLPTGVVQINNAGPLGVYTITIRVTDNCGLSTDAGFTLTVVNTTGGPNVTPVLPPGSPTIIFANVIVPGDTTVAPLDPASVGPLPPGYTLPGNTVAWGIATTCVFAGSVLQTFNVPATLTAAEFNQLRVLHAEPVAGQGLVLKDRTVIGACANLADLPPAPCMPQPNFANKQISARFTTLALGLNELTTTPVALRAANSSAPVLSPFVVVGLQVAPAVTVTASPVVSAFGQNVTLVASITNSGAPVTLGSVTFKEGANVLASNVALNTQGQASFNTAALTVGAHTITAEYSGAGLFLPASSSGTANVGCPAITINPATLANGVVGSPYGPQILSATPTGTSYSFAVTQGQLPPGLSLNGATLSGMPTAPGIYSFTITVTGVGNCTRSRAYSMLITGTCATVVVQPVNLPGGTLGTAYNQTISATGGGPYAFSVVNGALPAGLTLGAASGVLSGTPQLSGAFTLTIKAVGAGGCSGQRAYVLNIACSPLTLMPAALPAGRVREAYSQQLSVSPVSQATYSLTLGSLPPGFTLSNNGLLSGISSVAGTFNFTVKAVVGSCQGTKSYTLVLNNLAAVQHDFDGDGKSDPFNWNAKDGRWLIAGSRDGALQNFVFGAPGDVSAPGDYDGDGKCDAAVFRPANGTWYVRFSGNGQTQTKAWGAATDTPVPGDYDGDGRTDFAVWRGSEGKWYIWRSSDGAYHVEAWGANAAPYHDVPVPGDYDGDGKSDLAVFRRGNGAWLIKFSSGSSRDGATRVQTWGLGTDTPVAADYDGDGRTDMAVWRGQEGVWYILGSADGAVYTKTWGSQLPPYFDSAMPGDYDGDGKADVAVCRQGKTWYIVKSSDGALLTKQVAAP